MFLFCIWHLFLCLCVSRSSSVQWRSQDWVASKCLFHERHCHWCCQEPALQRWKHSHRWGKRFPDTLYSPRTIMVQLPDSPVLILPLLFSEILFSPEYFCFSVSPRIIFFSLHFSRTRFKFYLGELFQAWIWLTGGVTQDWDPHHRWEVSGWCHTTSWKPAKCWHWAVCYRWE